MNCHSHLSLCSNQGTAAYFSGSHLRCLLSMLQAQLGLWTPQAQKMHPMQQNLPKASCQVCQTLSSAALTTPTRDLRYIHIDHKWHACSINSSEHKTRLLLLGEFVNTAHVFCQGKEQQHPLREGCSDQGTKQTRHLWPHHCSLLLSVAWCTPLHHHCHLSSFESSADLLSGNAGRMQAQTSKTASRNPKEARPMRQSLWLTS